METPAAQCGRASAHPNPDHGPELCSGLGTDPVASVTVPRDALLALVVSAALTFTLGAFLQIRVSLGLGLVLTEILCIGAPALVVLRRHPALSAPPVFMRPRASRIARVGLCAVLAAIAAAALGVGARRLIGSVIDPAGMGTSLTPWSLAMVMLGLWVFAPVFEELLFRVTIQRALAHAMPGWTSILCASMLFAVYHGTLERIPETLTLGLFLGLIYHRTGSYWTAVAFHAGANIVGPPSFLAATGAPTAALAMVAGPAMLAAIWLIPRATAGLAPVARRTRAWPVLTAITGLLALGIGVEITNHVRALRTGYNIVAFPPPGWCEQEWSLGAHETFTVTERVTLASPGAPPDRLTPVAPGANLTSASIDAAMLRYIPDNGAWSLEPGSPAGRYFSLTWSVPLAALERTGDIFWIQTRTPIAVRGYRVECILMPGCGYIDPRNPARVRDTPYVANVLPGDVLQSFPKVGLTVRRTGSGASADKEVPRAESPDT